MYQYAYTIVVLHTMKINLLKKYKHNRMKKNIVIILTFFTLGLSAQSTSWNKAKLKEHWKTHSPDKIEGIYIKTRKFVQYNGFGQPKTYPNFVSDADFFIVNDGNEYVMASFSDDFYGTIRKTVGSNKYFLTTNLKYWGLESERKSLSMYLNSSNELVLEDVIYEKNLRASGVNYTNKAVFNDTYSMVYQPKIFEKPKTKSSGTGFSISSTGIIVTNYHVIENATNITVRGINSEFNKTYKAKVLVSDKNNDLALIQIDD